MNFLEADVPDPTDFPPQTSAPGLRALDGSFRCDICGELYDAPVTITCGHCFCSACIRSSLSIKQECPSCRKISNEAHIRPNPALESVISSWKEARPCILELIKRDKERDTPSSRGNTGPERKRKRNIEQGSGVDGVSGNAPGPSRHVYVLSPSSTTTPKAHSRTQKLKIKSSSVDTTIPSSDADEEELSLPLGAVPKKDSLVKCPICQKQIRYRLLNAHMDNDCKDPPVPREHNNKAVANSWSKIMNGAGDTQNRNGHYKGKHKKHESDSDDEHPLPITSYNTLKDRQLKDILAEQGLSVLGSRTIWEQRHQRWVMIFNANLDKSLPNRKTRAELKRELKKWEDERGKVKKPVVRDAHQYQIEHKVEFSRLVKQAKETKVKQLPVKPESEGVNSGTPVPSSSQSMAFSSSKNKDDVIVVDSEEERLSQRR